MGFFPLGGLVNEMWCFSQNSGGLATGSFGPEKLIMLNRWKFDDVKWVKNGVFIAFEATVFLALTLLLRQD